MDIEAFRAWLESYFRAWVSNDPHDVASLFTEDAVYAVGPFADPWRGRDEIVRRWTDGPQEDVEYSFEPLEVSDERGVAHWNARARRGGAPTRSELDGILVLTFSADGRCREHREWFVSRDLPD